MSTLQMNAVVGEDGSVKLQGLPFKPGETIVVTVETSLPTDTDHYPLRGSVIRYEDPFEPAIPPEHWEALE